MKINTSAPASAPTTDQPADAENESVAENGGADFSALLFLMLATPQAQPVTLPSGDIQSTDGTTGLACADGSCVAAPLLLAPTGEELFGASLLTGGNASGDNPEAGFPLVGFESTAENVLANAAEVVVPTLNQEPAPELALAQAVNDAPVENAVSQTLVTTANQSATVNAAKQLAGEAAEEARLPAQDDEQRVNPLLQREGFGSHANGNQTVTGVAASDALDGTGVKDPRDKDALDKPRDHSLQTDVMSASFAAALQSSNGAPRGEGAAAPFAAPVIDRVANEIATQVRTNQNEAIITLDPPELGSLRIALTLDGDKVQVRIIAEMTDSGNLIHNHLPELREALSGHRLDLVDVHIDSGNWNSASGDFTQNFNREFTDQRQGRGGREAADRPFNDNAPAAPVSPRLQPANTRTTRVSMWA